MLFLFIIYYFQNLMNSPGDNFFFSIFTEIQNFIHTGLCYYLQVAPFCKYRNLVFASRTIHYNLKVDK